MDETLQTVVNFQIYRLIARSTRYDSRDAKRTSSLQRRITHQMRSHHFDGMDPTWIFNFLKLIRTACISNGIHKGAAANFVPFFLTRSLGEKVKDLIATFSRMKTYGSDGPQCGSMYAELVQSLLIRYECERTISYAYEQLSTYTQAAQQVEVD